VGKAQRELCRQERLLVRFLPGVLQVFQRAEHDSGSSPREPGDRLDRRQQITLLTGPGDEELTMSTDFQRLKTVYKGWDDYQFSLVRALAPLTPEQLAWRPAPELRSVGELAGHIVAGRVSWLHRALGAGSPEFASQVAAWRPEDAIETKPAELVRWLERTWEMIEDALNQWTVADLDQVVDLPPYQGKKYALTRQWIIWRVLSHDIHHGGELAVMLGMQGIAIPELGDEGGHPAARAPLAEPS
jgi:uncharacterized damage-inducible protein DinB